MDALDTKDDNLWARVGRCGQLERLSWVREQDERGKRQAVSSAAAGKRLSSSRLLSLRKRFPALLATRSAVSPALEEKHFSSAQTAQW